MRRLLITGVSGYLGRHLASVAQSAAGWEVTGTYFSRPVPAASGAVRQIDLRDPGAVSQLIAAVQPDAVIHTACSNRDEGNISAIVPAAENLAAACRELGVRLVHVSTDLIFDGEHAPYSDDSPPAPIMPYGRAKAEAEAAVLHLCPSAAIARPSLIWALEPLDHQTTWLLDGLRGSTAVTLFTDEIRCPVHLSDLAAALLELAVRPHICGLLNLAGRQPLSRWDFGLRLLAALRVDRANHVVPGTVAASGLVRPRNLTLACPRAGQLLATRLRGVDEVLANAQSRAVPADQQIG